MNRTHSFANSWGVDFPDSPEWGDYISLIEKVCEKKSAYFIFKIDGERSSKKYTFALNIPHPIDAVIRCDSDDVRDGLMRVYDDLSALNIKP